mgnify:CR=1 FL=1
MKNSKSKLLRRLKRRWEKIDGIVYLLLIFALILCLWQTGVLHIILGQTYSQLPFPFNKTFTTENALTHAITTTSSIGIFNYAVSNFGTMMYNAGVTLSALIPGYAAGALLGYGCALLATLCRRWGGGVLVVLTILVSAPVVALAPAVNNMFGSEAPYAAKIVIIIITCAAGIACLKFYKDNDILGNVNRVGKVLGETLEAMKEKHRCVGDVRYIGLFSSVELVKDKKTKEPWVVYGKDPEGKMGRVCKLLRERGFMTYSHENMIFISPPLIITEAQMREELAKVEEVLSVLDKEI